MKNRINTNNYYYLTQSGILKKERLPNVLQKGWDYVDQVSKKGSDWSTYENDEAVKATVDLFFEKLSEHFKGKEFVLEHTKLNGTLSGRKKKTIETVLLNSPTVRKLMPRHQQMILSNELIETVENLEKSLSKIPPIYSQDGKSRKETQVYAHYFVGQSDWFITEMDIEGDTFFGYTILNGDTQMGELGYIRISELANHKSIELDFYWSKKSLAEALHEVDSDQFPKEQKTSSSSQEKKAKPSSGKGASNVDHFIKGQEIEPKQKGRTKKVESIAPELKFLRRYLNLNGQAKTRRQIRLFINQLQRAIVEKQIRKTSKYAEDIMTLQKDLIHLMGSFKNNDIMQVLISKRKQNKIREIISRQEEIPAIKYIRQYIALQGRPISRKKAKALHNKIARKVNTGVISLKDKYANQIQDILKHLKQLVEDNFIGGELKVPTRPLNGPHVNKNVPPSLDIERITAEFSNGSSRMSDNRFLMSSKELVHINFNHVGLRGKWFEFIGDPEIGFRLAIFGAPKMGKSYLMVEFAGYLAENHGKVLFVAKEEGKSATLQKKLRETQSIHPNMMVSNYIPENLDQFDFVFFDSVTKLGLTPENLIAINTAFPTTSFLEVHQVTKDGKARGLNDFVHDVDGIIEVYDKGKAQQYGRFNQGGQLDFFDENAA